MKTARLIPFIGALGLATLTGSAMAADGEINFRGEIKTSTCVIEVGDTSGGAPGVAYLGTVPTSALSNAGAVAGGGRFSLRIDDSDSQCDLTGKAASVTFLGLSGSAGASAQWLGIDRSVTGYATNVAIQIRDATGAEVPLSQASAEYLNPKQPLEFTANYISLGGATAGPANGKAAFTVDIH